MTTKTPANAWRDFEDLLTPEQVAWLEDFERTDEDAANLPLVLETVARDYARRNKANALYGAVPGPAGAVEVADWGHDDREGPCRTFVGTSRALDDRSEVAVDILGVQYPDGRVERWISFDGYSPLSSHRARVIASALIAAADEIAVLTGGEE